ncbi:zinc-ribbon and DUF3426 domain-containing protein [Pelistega suis]|uniref:DUF3426 domain-containing protein n=1 Tax=Pelistega suis TaxID=1631957 RepID=A0A849P7A0_9BURK|nr:zinc-ribbon and DUF3426 domain-containing protein [Pelistega suis]NOL50857.1 DUF3426 domain-containing protein [Pelistega suis]
MMKTCCPQCETVLTLNQQQIEQRNGMVRCGVCRQVFNALEHLYEEEDDYPILNEDHEPELIQPHVEPHYRAHQSSSPKFSGAVRPVEVPRKEEHAQPTVHIHVNNAVPSAPTHERGEPRIVMNAVEPEDNHYIGGDARHTRDVRIHDDDSDFRIVGDSVYDEDYEPTRRRSSGLGLFVLVLLALLLIVGQVFYIFRNQISTSFPAARPVLTQMCALFKCEVGVQKSVDNLGLENVLISVDKTKLPKRGQHALLLQAVLVNKVDQAQEWPMLILRLKNAEGAVMNSKNIQPKEYLATEQVLQLFPAQSRQAINLPFMLEGDAISSYEVSIFYP